VAARAALGAILHLAGELAAGPSMSAPRVFGWVATRPAMHQNFAKAAMCSGPSAESGVRDALTESG